MTNKGARHTYSKNDLIDLLVDMRINKGMTRMEMMNYLINDLKYAKSSAYELMQKARNEIDERSLQAFADDIKEDIERWEAELSKCEKEKDRKGVRDCLREICKLKGHYIERLDVTSKGKDITEIKLIHISSPMQSKDNENK